MNGYFGYVAPQSNGHFGRRTCCADAFRRCAGHQKSTAAQRLARDIGESAVVAARSLFRQGEQGCFGRNVFIDGSIRQRIEFDTLTGCRTRQGERGASG